jgi:lysophospholipase L1-like esterase
VRWLTNAVVVLVAAALPCVALEVWLRATALPPDTPNLFVRLPPPVEWSGRPLARGTHSGVPVAFNQHGLRDRERSLEPAAGTTRVLVLGDSVTFGMGVPFEDTYPARTEARLNASLGGAATVEVLNFGIPGYNTLHSLAQLRELGLAFRPDIVVVGFLYNDVELSTRQRESGASASTGASTPSAPSFGRSLKSAVNAGVLYLKQNTYFFPWLTPRLGMALRPLGFSGFGQVGEFKDQYADSNPNWQRMRSALLEMQALGGEYDFDLALMIIPAMARFDDAGYPLKEYHQAVLSFGRESGIASLDLLSAFWGLDGTQLWISPTDGHPNARGHQIMADALADFLAPLVHKHIAH